MYTPDNRAAYGVKRLIADECGLGSSVGSARGPLLNQKIKSSMSDLVGRMEENNKAAVTRAEMIERMADLLCGGLNVGGAGNDFSQPPSPSALLSRLEGEIDYGDRINARIDAALHRISRRLTPSLPPSA